ncbi:MAG TPA: two-component regulator propeller domain-containing protein, partial [Flavobacteriales bacterium]|nr:two-component regulator propeller domain-containing protein [Flavobacteriales bacterium]
MWINAAKHLVFFDAKAERWITHTDDPAFACINDTLALDPEPDGHAGIWYFTATTGELVHADATGKVLSKLNHGGSGLGLHSPQFIRLDGDGNIWLSTWNHDLYAFEATTLVQRSFLHNERELWSINSSNAKSWLQDRDGRIWVGTFNGLNVIDPERAQLHPHRLDLASAKGGINCLLPTAAHTWLLGTDSGLVVYDPTNGQQRRLTITEPKKDPAFAPYLNIIRTIVPHGSGYLVGTLDGLLTLDAQATHLSRPQALFANDARLERGTISFIAKDDGANTWIGKASGGLFRITGDHVGYFDSLSTTPLPNRNVLSCAVGKDGTWFGLTSGGGACLVKDGRIVQRVLNEADADGANYGVVLGLALDGNGTLYLGTLMGGLGVLTADGEGID